MKDQSPKATGMPRWVKVSLIVVGILIAVFVILNLAGMGGRHGPSRHLGSGRSGSAPASFGGDGPS
jgi:hypothetical protein